MLFNSFEFLVFFAVVLLVHHRLPLPWTVRKTFLLVASYAFYAAWSAPFSLLLAFSTLIDWWTAGAMHRSASPRARRGWLLLSLVSNLGLLGFFKYGAFALRNAAAAGEALGLEWAAPAWDIVLPVGISFYTFQTLSYTIDVYRGHLRPAGSFLDFALFVSFFPQLVAGPIVRAADFLPQCEAPRRASPREMGWGLVLLVFGLFSKVVLADELLAPQVDRVFGAATAPGFTDAWAGMFGFTAQIYSDFAGYSLCAVGVALCLGFHMPDNFRFPFAAAGFADFWHRWHISLSTWLRDYLYIPLGGNRRGPRRTLIHLGLTMLLGGLWHGADWRFVAWGAVHGLFLILERGIAPRLAGRPWTKGFAARTALILGTFLGVAFAFVLFRADSFGRATELYGALCGIGAGPSLLRGPQIALVLMVTAAMVVAHARLRSTTLEDAWSRMPRWGTALVLGAALAALALSPAVDRAFLYFQF